MEPLFWQKKRSSYGVNNKTAIKCELVCVQDVFNHLRKITNVYFDAHRFKSYTLLITVKLRKSRSPENNVKNCCNLIKIENIDTLDSSKS